MLAGSPSRADVHILSTAMSLFGGNRSILNHPLVIHAQPDDLGLGGSAKSRTGGNSGPVVTCAMIQLADSVGEPQQLTTRSIVDKVDKVVRIVDRSTQEEEKALGNIEHPLYGGMQVDERPWKEWAPSYASQQPTLEKKNSDLDFSIRDPSSTDKGFN